MKCIYCGNLDSKVVDSRISSNAIRRRRECSGCTQRFTSYEVVELVPIRIIKRDGSLESFNPEKIKRGVARACEKRPISTDQIDRVVGNVEKSLTSSIEEDVPVDRIGDLILQELKTLDEIAYVRFAAVYKKFKDIKSFQEFLKNI